MGAVGGLEGLLERIEDTVVLIAHVRDIDAALVGQQLRQRDHLVHVGGRVRLVVQAGAEADRARIQPLGQAVPHGVDFPGRGFLPDVVHAGEAQRAVADEIGDVGARLRGGDGLDIVRHALEAEVFEATQQVEGRRRRLHPAEGNRRKAYAAVPGDHGRHALTDLGDHVGADKDRVVVVGVGVDEARRDNAAGGVDLARAARVPDSTGFRDGANPVAPERHIGAPPWRARAVDHLAVA